jgi:hypothetical protein
MLKEFSEAKGVTIEEYKFEPPTKEQWMEIIDDLRRKHKQLRSLEKKLETHFPS